MVYHLQSEAKEALFKAHFTDGLDINDIDVVKQIAASIGINPETLSNLVGQNNYIEAVNADQEMAREKGIRAVPYYLINSTYQSSGSKK